MKKLKFALEANFILIVKIFKSNYQSKQQISK